MGESKTEVMTIPLNELGSRPVQEVVADIRIRSRIEELLKDRASTFESTLIQLVNENRKLKGCDSLTVVNAALTAAALNLPIGPGFGFAYVVPYNYKDKNGKWRKAAQFQLGYKGWVQLALRTNQFVKINALPVYINQFESFDRLTEELRGDFQQQGQGLLLGYAAFFEMKNGFRKTVYWTKDQVHKHAEKFSKTYGSEDGVWETSTDAMGVKTVLKNMLEKWALVSIDLLMASRADMSIQYQEGEYKYLDNPRNGGLKIQEVDEEKERERILQHIKQAGSLDELAQVRDLVSEYDLADEYADKSAFLTEE